MAELNGLKTLEEISLEESDAPEFLEADKLIEFLDKKFYGNKGAMGRYLEAKEEKLQDRIDYFRKVRGDIGLE